MALPRIPRRRPQEPQDSREWAARDREKGSTWESNQSLPKATIRSLFAVYCPHCEEMVKNPFADSVIWDLPAYIIRRFHTCEHCKGRFRIK